MSALSTRGHREDMLDLHVFVAASVEFRKVLGYVVLQAEVNTLVIECPHRECRCERFRNRPRGSLGRGVVSSVVSLVDYRVVLGDHDSCRAGSVQVVGDGFLSVVRVRLGQIYRLSSLVEFPHVIVPARFNTVGGEYLIHVPIVLWCFVPRM